MTRILQRSAALVLCFLASASTENQHQRQLREHYAHLSHIADFPCGEPQVRVMSVHKLFSESQTYGKVAYFPDVTVLSRCDEFCGSCNSDTKCGPKESVTVALPFKVTFLEDTMQHKKGSWIIEFHELVNHTLCECIDNDSFSEGFESRRTHNHEIDARISSLCHDQGNSDACIDPNCALEGSHDKEHVYAAFYFDQLVEETYQGNVNNANKILSAISKLEIQGSIIALSSLYNTMKAHNHLDSYQLIMLAFKAKHVPHQDGYDKLDKTSKQTLEKLMDSLPIKVLNFVKCGSKCTLLNKKHNETIYPVMDYLKLHDHRRSVYTWIPRNDNSSQFDWDFEAVNDGEYFMMKNVMFSEYLYASKEVPVTDTEGMRRNVFTVTSKVAVLSEGLWRVTPTDNGKYFTLQNGRYEDEFLYASGNMEFARDSGRRGVFTWRGKNEEDLKQIEKDWNFDCCCDCP